MRASGLYVTISTISVKDHCQHGPQSRLSMVGNRVKLIIIIHNMVSMLSETNFTYKNFVLCQGQIW